MLRFGRPDVTALEVARASVAGRALTYGAVGSSLTGEAVPGFHTHVEGREIGRGSADLAAARAGLRAWQAHAGVGATVHPHAAPIEEGQVVVVSLPAGPVTVLAPCRIVAVVDEVDRFGFAYGTLPGHPVSGEEAFVVSLDPGGAVRFEVRVVARPASFAMRLGEPVARAVEHRAMRRYLKGLARHVSHSDG